MAWGPSWLRQPSQWERRLVEESFWKQYSRRTRVMWLAVLAAVFLLAGVGTLLLLGATAVQGVVLTLVVAAIFFSGVVPIVLGNDQAALRAIWISRTLVLACLGVVVALSVLKIVISTVTG